MSDTTTRCTFTRDSLTIDGITRPAEYSVTPAGTVFVVHDGWTVVCRIQNGKEV